MTRQHHSFCATEVGPVAHGLLKGGEKFRGQVIAVFNPVFYVEFEAEILCVTRSGVDHGPISLVTSAPGDLEWPKLQLEPGQSAHSIDGRIVISDGLEILYAPAKKWMPPSFLNLPDPNVVERGLEQARNIAVGLNRSDGLAGFLADDHVPESLDLVGSAAAGPIAEARNWLSSQFAGMETDREWARRLIGLGPGLTPSGDDFLGGFMIAVHALGRGDIAKRIWADIGESAHASTNAISFAFLSAASKGWGSSSLHAALEAVVSGQNPAAAIASLARQGHSSGLDAFAGVTSAIQFWSKHRCELIS